VVDLGAGTGLSSGIWSGQAERVVGIEPSGTMIEAATRQGVAGSVELRQSLASATGLADGCADIVTAVQSFHWMDPEPTLSEIARITRSGGVFAAIDYEAPPSVDVDVEAAGHRFVDATRRLAWERGVFFRLPAGWPKNGHLESLEQSGHFRFLKEVPLHSVEFGDASRYLELNINWGAPFVEDLRHLGISDEELQLVEYRAAAERVIGRGGCWFLSWKVRLGVRT